MYNDFDGRTTTAMGSTRRQWVGQRRGATTARGSRATGGTTTSTVGMMMARGSRATGGTMTGHGDGNGRHDNATRQLGRAARQQRWAAHDGRNGDAARRRGTTTARGSRATGGTTTSTGGTTTARGSRGTDGTTTATSRPDDSTIN